jgi:integrase
MTTTTTGASVQLADTIDAWVADAIERLRLEPVNARRSGHFVRRFLRETAAKHPSHLSPLMLAGWLASLNASPATCRNYCVGLRSWGRFLALQGFVAASPFASVKTPRVGDTKRGADPLSDDQVEQLLANAREECEHERWQVRANAPARLAAYHLMLDAGLRIGEVRAQLWGDVDLDAATLTVTADKARRRDRLPLPHRTVEVLRWWRELAKARGFCSPDARVVPSGPNAKKMRLDLDRVGASGEPGRFHRLRKHAITSRARSGADVWRLCQWARHRDPKTTLRYVRAGVEELRDLAEFKGTPAPASSSTPTLPAMPPDARAIVDAVLAMVREQVQAAG